MIPAVVMSLVMFAAAQQVPTPEQKKAMLEQVQPGPQHRELAALEGRWTQEITYNAGGKPLKGHGSMLRPTSSGAR